MRRKFNQRGAIGTILLGLAAAGMATWGISYLVTGSNEAILGLLRTIGIFIDTQVYSISSWAYSIFYEVSSSSLLSSLNLASAAQRLYTLLGIFMLFRLAFSFIKYIINPDGMEKGTGKLLTNLAVSLALIVSVPWIFNRAFALQNYIMDSNVIGNLIMGMNNDENNNDSFNAASYGQAISFLTFSAFYSPNLSITELSSCGNILYYYSDNLKIAADGTKLDESNGENDKSLSKEEVKIAKCVNSLNSISVDDKNSNNSAVEIGTMFYIASQRYNFGLLTDPNVLNAIYGNQYVINYTAIVSTFAGGFLALLFLNFCFDVAIRNVKLCFLQIIAPIPIILNIEPGDSKGDKKSLNWWAKESLKTYVDLFVRVATVYFGVFLINVIFGVGEGVAGSQNTSTWFQVFMILGILLFVKQIPEMIGKAFGIDVKGQFSLNPLKRIGDNRITSMALGGVAGLATGALGGGLAAYKGARSAGAGRGEAFRRAITGGADTAVHGLTGGAKKGVKSIHDITSNARENMARSGRIAASNVGTTWHGRTGAGIAMATGVRTKSDIINDQADAMEKYGSAFGNMKSFALTSKEDTGITRYAGGGFTIHNSSGLNTYLDRLRKDAVKARDEGDTARERALMTKISSLDTDTMREDLDAGKLTISEGHRAGASFTNVKDANDHLERLRASGASVSQIKAAEDVVSAMTNDYIDANRGNQQHAIGAMWSQAMDVYNQNASIMGQYHIDRATDAASLKSNITAAKSGASALKNSREATTAARNKAAAQAKHGK